MMILQDVSLKGGKSITTETWLSRIDQEQMMNLNMSNGPERLTGIQVSLIEDSVELEKSGISRSWILSCLSEIGIVGSGATCKCLKLTAIFGQQAFLLCA